MVADPDNFGDRQLRQLRVALGVGRPGDDQGDVRIDEAGCGDRLECGTAESDVGEFCENDNHE